MNAQDQILLQLSEIRTTLTTMGTDLTWMKEDLAEHKEGVIQNRAAIAKNNHFISQLIGAGKLLGIISVITGVVVAWATFPGSV